MPLSIRGGTTALGGTEDKEYFIRKMLERAIPKQYHAKFGNKDYIPTRGGQSAEWRRWSAFTTSTTALTEGTPGAETIPTVVTVTATINQYGMYYRQTDIADKQSIDDLRIEGAEALGEAMGDAYDLLTRNIMRGTTSIQYASTAASRGAVGSGMRLNAAELREALATLKTNNANPFEDGGYKAIIHPRTEADLFNDPTIVNAFAQAGVRGESNPLFKGSLGRYLGCDFYTTSNASIQAAGGLSVAATAADVYQTMIFGKNAYGILELSAFNTEIIYHPTGSSGVNDPLNQLSSQGYKFSHSGAILNNSWIVSIEHTTSLGVE